MGTACSKLCSKKKIIRPALKDEPEPEIAFEKKTSSLDHYYKKIENDYNFLKYFQLYEYILLVTNMRVGEDDANSIHDKDYLEEIDKARFCLLLDNRILKNHVIYSIVVENESNTNIFRDFQLELYEAMLRANIDLFKKKHPDVKVKKGSIVAVRKLYIYAIGLLYCNANNRTKVNFFRNLFVNSQNLVEVDENFENFLFFLFIIPSTCSLRALKALTDKYDRLEKIDEEGYLKILDNFEIKDILRLKDIFIKEFFGEAKSLNATDFENKFTGVGRTNFGWIFDACGIREALERNNDVAPTEA
jgi:hypothetical protein